jgi:hypothetical protein
MTAPIVGVGNYIKAGQLRNAWMSRQRRSTSLMRRPCNMG